MSYNLNAIKKKIADLSGGRDGSNRKRRPKLNWFKPKLADGNSPNSYELRFLPYQDADGQPFQEVSYYDHKSLSERRIVAPAQFGMDDPIIDFLDELRQEGTSDSWKLWNTLRAKDRFYAPVLVRGEEDRGVQIWELNAKILKDIYAILAHPDYADEDMMDPEEGFDFTLRVTDTGKKFGKYAVKNYDIQPRRKPSKLATTKKAREELVESVPNLEEYFKSLVPDAEFLNKTIENFAQRMLDGDDDSSSNNNNNAAEETDKRSASRGASKEDSDKKASQDIDEAFADLDDDDIPF